MLHLFRASSAEVFVDGGESPEELIVIEILDRINSRPGGGTVLVLINGLERWSTDAPSIVAMASRWRNIRFRLTFMVPADSVGNIPYFNHRKNPSRQQWTQSSPLVISNCPRL
jgi:hypothetical protein